MWHAPQFVLSVDVQRVEPAAGTGRQHPPPQLPAPDAAQGDLSEPEQLQRISALVISEWNHFVSREKRVRAIRVLACMRAS